MSAIRVFSGATIGLDALPIEVEVDATPGLHFFNIVGLPDKTVEESKDRIASAIKNSGFIAPKQKNYRIIVNLAPADIKKQGPAYDLPIAVGYLLSTKQIKIGTKKTLLFGELALNGSLRRINGVLSLVSMGKLNGFDQVILPKENIEEASVISGIEVIGASNLKEVVRHLDGTSPITSSSSIDYQSLISDIDKNDENEMDISDIRGQESAKRALLISASGGHNILMYGPPGSGKTMLAKALPGILPPMSHDEAIEVTKIYSIAGLIQNEPLLTKRAFRSPHHTTSSIAIVGGGSWPRPGEISLAHRGVLFLDEFPEFPRDVIEALRQPMESGDVVIARASQSVKFPARFMLVTAMNPCPCGNYGNDFKQCICSAGAVNKYQRKISGPVLDRIDIQITVPRETYEKISGESSGKKNKELRNIVETARNKQQARFTNSKTKLNSEMNSKEISKFCKMDKDAEEFLKRVVTTHHISGRSYHKILKIARTIADIDSQENIKTHHLAEAVGYRTMFESAI